MASSQVNVQIAQAISKLQQAQGKVNGNAAALVAKAIGDCQAAIVAALLKPDQGG